MTLTIHRGTHEIGGSCIELVTASSRLFLDFGLPLVDREGNPLKIARGQSPTFDELVNTGIAPSIPYFKNPDNKRTFLTLSHSHLDHHGLAPWLPNGIPVYASLGTKKLLEIAFYFGQSLFDPVKVNAIEPKKQVSIGDFIITPFPADHSAIDAFSFLIEAEGKRLFYSGDLRSHGRTGYKFAKLIAEPPRDIDYLILEGSTLGRDTAKVETEFDVEMQLNRELSRNGLYLASFPSQNIDRFVSFFKACRKTKRVLVVDPYTASVLDSLRELSSSLPQFDWQDSFKIWFIQNSYTRKMGDDESLFKFKHAKITLDEIKAEPERLVIKENFAIRERMMKEGLLNNAKLIYSMWEGYLKENTFWQSNNVPMTCIHSTGHAYKEDLVRLVEALQPTKVIPNHTFYPDEFKVMFGERASLLNDGQVVEC
jgi:ribonuclease J